MPGPRSVLQISNKAWRVTSLLVALGVGIGHCQSVDETEARVGECSWNNRGLISPLRTTCPLPIDDESVEDGGDWAPWTYPPICVDLKPQESSPSVKNKEKLPPKYCVYTQVPFRGEHGISLITTPEMAASVSTGLDDSVVAPRLRDHPASWLNTNPDVEFSFDLKEFAGSGVGSVARRKIRQWETILVGFPAILARMDFMDVLDPEGVREVMAKSLTQLPKVEQEEIFGLSRSTGGGIIQDILKTNIFGVEVEGDMHMALMPEASRINHGCRPNTFWRYNPKTLALEMVAMRDIEVGEEIAFTYTPLGLTHEGRQNVLKDWGFQCKCPLCTASKKEIKLSDQRRERIHEINNILSGDERLSSTRISNYVDELMALVDKEALWAQVVVYYEVFARAYLGVQDLKNATKYARLCEKAWIQHEGEEHENVAGIRKLRQDLERAQSSV